MGLWQDITSAIGSVFGGGNNSASSSDYNNQKKKQNTPAISGQKINLPSVFKAPNSIGPSQNNNQNNNQNNIPIFTQPDPIAHIDLTAHSIASPAPPNPAPSQSPPSSPPQHTSLFGHLLHGVEDVGEGAAGALAGASAAALRAGEGLASGVADVPNLVVHAVTKPGRMIGGPDNPVVQYLNKVDQQSQRVTNDVQDPLNFLAQKTDMIPGMLNHGDGTPTIAGRVASDIYKPAQVAANVAAIVPGVVAGASKIGQIAGDTSEVPNALKVAKNFVERQSNIPNLSKVPVLGTALNKIPGVGEPAEVADEPTPPESGTKPIEVKPTNAPVGEPTEPTPVPNAPESGVKPVVQPATPVHTLPDGSTGTPLTPEQEYAKLTTPPPEVQAAENAAQAAVDKTATTPPAPEPAPVAAPNVTPNQAASEAVAASPEQQVVNEAPNVRDELLKKTGNATQDTQNATQYVRHLLENGRDYSEAPNPQDKNVLQRALDVANAHLQSNGKVSDILNSRLGDTLTDDEAKNVVNAIEMRNANGLNPNESAVYKAIQENIENPSNTVRTNLSKDYQAADNHFPQVRQTSVRDAVKGASRSKGVNSKIDTFNDLLNRNSRFSQGSTMGKFTSGGKTVVGDASDLGLVAKKDGTFVDKNGKVYNYSRATSQELENAGVKLQSPKDALAAYTRDTLNLKTRADAADYLVKNADTLGLSDAEAAGKSNPLTLKGSDGKEHTFFTDAKTAKDIQKSGIIGDFSKDANLPTKAWNALSSLVAQATVMNPTAHSLNLEANAAIGSGLRRNGLTGLGAIKDSLQPIDDAKELRMSDAGVHLPTYGKDKVNLISKLTHGASKLNEKAISTIDKHARAGMFDQLTQGGMTDKQAAAAVNDFLGGRQVYGGGNAQLGIFWKYFVRQNVNAGRILSEAAKGHPTALINAMIAGGATYGVDKGMQAATGNPNASIHAPGVIGIANDYLKSGNALLHGRFRDTVNPVVSHVNPLVQEVAKQTLGVDNYGNKFKNGAARGQDILGMTPVTNAFNNNGHSLGEKALNTFGAYTPHAKGDMAVSASNPVAPILNVKGARNGATIAFPKDFTGEQSSKAMDSSGLKYSTQTAAQFNAQPQSQQQAITKAAADLKTVGITSPSLAFQYAKLSPAEQTNYKQAVTQLNQSGTSVSTKAIQEQLLTNGNKSLAGKLNTDAPGATYSAQEAVDKTNFEKSGQDSQSIDGFHFENTSNPNSPKVMEQKDYDYKQADDAITSAKNSGDVSGFIDGTQKLLGNIGWQLNHADLTQSQRDALVQKAVQQQEEYAKTQQYGGFTKPKDADTYATPQITGAKSGYIKAIQEAGAKHGVDINALISVAAQEGLGGGVGDNGTSFGPFQMHQGGALPQGKDQAWAESPAGIDYAVQQIKNVVGDKTGPAAIQAIVNGFEKSADQPTEIANALALYSGGSATLSPGGNTITSGSGSGSGSSASARDRAAGLPSGDAVVKPGSATGLKAGTAKYAAPTLAVAKAGTSKNDNPFVRSISATTGVK